MSDLLGDFFVFALMFIVGAIVGIIIGFVVLVSTAHVAPFTDARIFPFWLLHPITFGWWPWPILSGIAAALSTLACRASSDDNSN